MRGGLLAGQPGGLDAGLDERVAGVMKAGWEGWRTDGLSDAGVAPTVGVAGDEVLSGEFPNLLDR